MVAGGPYGLEDIMGEAGYGLALLLLVLVPIFWSLPTALMVGELASAIPDEGGYYVWVRRALGGFWGFRRRGSPLTASIFDMALLPGHLRALSRPGGAATDPPGMGRSRGSWPSSSAACSGICAGQKPSAEVRSCLFAVMLAPFAVLVATGLWHGFAAHAAGGGLMALRKPIASPNLLGALSVCLWNYMGWDNASTVAQEVEDPQRTYPRAMLIAAALVAVTYILPLAAVAIAGIPAEQFSTGAWAVAAKEIGGSKLFGTALSLAVVAGGTISGIGMFNALMMSYTRIPYALAEERLLPRIFARTTAAGVPWASVLLCAVAWGLAVQMSFERLISIDLVLYGAALLLEFVALVVLRLREPALARPFRVPGGTAGAIAAGIGPAILIGFAMYAARDEKMARIPALAFAAIIAVCGPVLYAAARKWQATKASGK